MKHKLLILGIAIILILMMLPAAALAYEHSGKTCSEHDYNALVSFLNLPSAVPGQTNAQRLGYDMVVEASKTDAKTGGSGLICVLLWMGIPILAAIIVRILLQRWNKDPDFVMPGIIPALARRLSRKRKNDDD